MEPMGRYAVCRGYIRLKGLRAERREFQRGTRFRGLGFRGLELRGLGV